jgi:hypothetical protein
MFPFHYRVLQRLACYWGWFCQFVLVGSTVWLTYLLDLFLLILVHIVIIIIIIIIIVIIITTVMQGIYNYIPETNISGAYSVAAVLYSQFVVHVMLFPM